MNHRQVASPILCVGSHDTIRRALRRALWVIVTVRSLRHPDRKVAENLAGVVDDPLVVVSVEGKAKPEVNMTSVGDLGYIRAGGSGQEL